MEYSSDAHSSQPATATQVLLTNLGVCLRGVGEQASILGPLTLTLLPFSWMASLDTFLFSYIFFKSLSIFSFWALENFFFALYTLPSNHLLLSPSLSSHYLRAKSSTISNHVLSITYSPPSRLCLYPLCPNYLFSPFGQPLRLSPSLLPHSCLCSIPCFQINFIFSNCHNVRTQHLQYLLMIPTESCPVFFQL